MEVVRVDDKKQMFDGVVYYKCGFYYQKKGVRLHRKVWEHHNGPIPKGKHIHHVDSNRDNNNIENLQLLDGGVHQKQHQKEDGRIAYGKMHIERIRPLAIEWHKSEKGKEWHSRQSKENWAKRKPMKYICSFCGKEFESLNRYTEAENRFCHQNCKAKFRTRRLRDEKNQINNICR